MRPNGSKVLKGICALIFAVQVGSAAAQDEPARTLITNVHVFDGVNEHRIENANVLVEGNLVTTVSTDEIDADGATVIDGGGRTLMPGLIDAHWHSMYVGLALSVLATGDMV